MIYCFYTASSNYPKYPHPHPPIWKLVSWSVCHLVYTSLDPAILDFAQRLNDHKGRRQNSFPPTTNFSQNATEPSKGISYLVGDLCRHFTKLTGPCAYTLHSNPILPTDATNGLLWLVTYNSQTGHQYFPECFCHPTLGNFDISPNKHKNTGSRIEKSFWSSAIIHPCVSYIITSILLTAQGPFSTLKTLVQSGYWISVLICSVNVAAPFGSRWGYWQEPCWK